MKRARYQLTMLFSFVCSLVLTLSFIGAWPGCAEASDASPDLLKAEEQKLQEALDLVCQDPHQAEGLLEQLHSPSAKAYLAYLYKSGKVSKTNSPNLVDNLMHEAILQACSSSSNPNIAVMELCKLASERKHYSDMSELLYDLRSITDYGDIGRLSHPVCLFKEHPEEAFAAFSPRYGSSLDYGINLKLSDEDDIRELPATAKLIAILEELCGHMAWTCQGTIRNYFGCLQQLAVLEASLAPQNFHSSTGGNLPEGKTLESAEADLNKFLVVWSNEELWNKYKHNEWLVAKEKAIPELTRFYINRLKLDPNKAAICAKAAVVGISLGYIELPSQETFDKAKTKTYTVFSRRQLSIKSMQAMLGDISLSPPELTEALRLSILNDAEPEVIDYLLKQGAPLGGKRETPLFTAVLRPDVEKLLIKAGADVNAANAVGKTALIQAAQYNGVDSMKLLVAAGADINHAMIAVDSIETKRLDCDYNYTVGGRTPLMYAAWFADYPAIDYLIASGANKAAVDSNGVTARSYLDINKVTTQIQKEALTKKL